MLCAAFGAAPGHAAAPTAQEVKDALAASAPLATGIAIDRARLLAAYRGRDFAPVWAQHPEMAAALVTALAAAGSDGIAPANLGLDELKVALADQPLSPAARDLLLSDRFLAFAQILAQGQVAPGAIEGDWLLARPEFDPAAALARLERSGDVAAALDAWRPQSPDYARLRAALARYEALAAAGGWNPIPQDSKIEPGQSGELAKQLRMRLVAEGDLPVTQAGGEIYDAPVVAALKRFQQRHGLEVDGRVGRATVAALNVPVADRSETLRLNLERLRGMPRDWPARRVVVNTAAAELALYADGAPQLMSRVIVGAPNHPSPVLAAQIEAVLFNPPWNVPTSIVRNEIQPRLRRDPGFLARGHYVLIGGPADSAGVDWGRETILGNGWRLQQEPGPWNSLGRIKLELPNPMDVYLHDTPTRALFQKSVRTLSHGCIRVEAVKALAAALLGAEWPIEAIDRAIEEGVTRRVPLARNVPVYIVYLTAFADSDGTVEFRDDVYGRDRRLMAALMRLKAGQLVAAHAPERPDAGCPTT